MDGRRAIRNTDQNVRMPKFQNKYLNTPLKRHWPWKVYLKIEKGWIYFTIIVFVHSGVARSMLTFVDSAHFTLISSDRRVAQFSQAVVIIVQ